MLHKSYQDSEYDLKKTQTPTTSSSLKSLPPWVAYGLVLRYSTRPARWVPMIFWGWALLPSRILQGRPGIETHTDKSWGWFTSTPARHLWQACLNFSKRLWLSFPGCHYVTRDHSWKLLCRPPYYSWTSFSLLAFLEAYQVSRKKTVVVSTESRYGRSLNSTAKQHLQLL